MTTDENKPSHGAIVAARAIDLAQNEILTPDARIIDSHTNAIADELKDAINEIFGMAVAWSAYWQHSDAYGCGEASPIHMKAIETANAALARYNAAKSKEAK